MEDIFPNPSWEPERWKLLGKAQAYGLLPWDFRVELSEKDLSFGFSELLFAGSTEKALFQIYRHLICEIRTAHYRRLEQLVEVFEKGSATTLKLDLPPKVILAVVEQRQKLQVVDEEGLALLENNYLDGLEEACEDKRITVPVHRFYIQMLRAFQF